MTREQQTYEALRHWLTLGRVLPGQRLKLRDVAAELGVGLMPVRAALQRLAAEGALTYSPNRGVSVPQLSRAEFDDVLQTRLLLEGEATERGALRLSAADREALGVDTRRMELALRELDAKTYLAVNEDFHLRLYRAAGSPLLMTLIETVWLRIGPLSNQLFEDSAAPAVLNDGHDDLMRALHAGDSAAARRAIERDLFVAGQFLRLRCSEPSGRRAPP
ncbi:MAG: GntR family transcriptional regulator [Burkholderiaceae bacterium]|jgi:DNA-binding GntR family transcriptional regulator